MGRVAGNDEDRAARRILRIRRALFYALPPVLALSLGLVQPAQAGPDPEAEAAASARAPGPDSAAAWSETAARARADSLRARAERRLRALADLPDSERVQALDEALVELGGAIENISRELSTLDLQIEDQAISLRDRAGGGRVRIDIPPDLGAQISRGISSITASILQELPDSIVVRTHPAPPAIPGGLDVARAPRPAEPPVLVVPVRRPRHVIGGDVVRVLGDVVVEENEEVSGNAIAVFGDVRVRGRVNGDAVAVLGSLDLAGDARIAGDAVAVLGRLDRSTGSSVQGSTFALNPGWGPRLGGGRNLLWVGWPALAIRTTLFFISACLLMLLLTLAPSARLESARLALARRPLRCLGHGALWLLAGHLLLGFLAGVLVLTIIGIPLALLLAVLYLAVAVLAQGVVAWELAARRADPAGGRGGSPSRALLGLLLIHSPGLAGALIGLLPGMQGFAVSLGIFDIVVGLAAFGAGLGALVDTRFGTRELPVPALNPA